MEGDEILKAFSSRVKHIIRESDIAARWGGEEFAILAVNTDLERARMLAEKVRSDIEGRKFANGTGFTISIGAAQFRDGDDAASFLERADQALYRAKENGRNIVCVAE